MLVKPQQKPQSQTCWSMVPMMFPVLLYRSNLSLAELGLVDSTHPSAEERLHLSPERLRVTSEDNFWSMMLHVYNQTQA